MTETHPKELMSQSLASEEDTSTADNRDNMPNVQNVNGRSVVVGQLPDDFLRLDSSTTATTNRNEGRSQIEIDEELAASLQQQYNSQAIMARQNHWNLNYQAYLSVTFVEGHLVKNYGLMNMSLYVRLRVGQTIYETHTSNRCGKNPKWNDTCRCYLPNDVDTISIELYDDCLFTQDELIAWASYKIPSNFLRFSNETPEHTFEEKIVLSGKQGEGMEGELMVAFNTKPITAETMRTYFTTPVYVPNPNYLLSRPPILANPLIVHQSPIPATTLLQPAPSPAVMTPAPITPQPQPFQIKEEDVKTLVEMFPNIEVDVIKSVLTNERGNLERAITNLLEINSTT